MYNLSKNTKKVKNSCSDFVCPIPETRELFNPDYIIWVDTIKKGLKTLTNYLFNRKLRL